MSKTLKKYYLTFGQKYRVEKHPAGDWIHPDGWVTILAFDEDEARQIAFDNFGQQWSMLYDKKPKNSLFKLGELKVI